MICIQCGEKDNEIDKHGEHGTMKVCANDGLFQYTEGTRKPISTTKLVKIFLNNDRYTEWRHFYNRYHDRWEREIRTEFDLNQLRGNLSSPQCNKIVENIYKYRQELPYAYGSDIIRFAVFGTLFNTCIGTLASCGENHREHRCIDCSYNYNIRYVKKCDKCVSGNCKFKDGNF